MAAIAKPVGLLGRLLDLRVLRWVGVRSYGIYLWHWPIFLLTRPGIDLPAGPWFALAVRVIATVAVAEVSFRYLETPVREGALSRAWRAVKVAGRLPHTAPRRRQWIGGAALTLPALALIVALVAATPGAPPSYMANLHDVDGPVGAPSTRSAAAPGSVTRPPSASTSQPPEASPPSTARPSPSSASTPSPPASQPSVAAGLGPAGTVPPPSGDGECTTVSAVGDSVLLAALPVLRQHLPQLTFVDADVGMQVKGGISALREQVASHQLGCVVVVALGTNGAFSAGQFDTIMTLVAAAHEVVFVNVNVPRSWADHDNAVIAQGVSRYRHAVEVDWQTASSGKPDLFYPDGIHPGPAGQQVYAHLVASAVDPYLEGAAG